MVNNLLIVSFSFLPRMGTDFVFRTTNLTNYALAPLVLASGMKTLGSIADSCERSNAAKSVFSVLSVCDLKKSLRFLRSQRETKIVVCVRQKNIRARKHPALHKAL